MAAFWRSAFGLVYHRAVLSFSSRTRKHLYRAGAAIAAAGVALAAWMGEARAAEPCGRVRFLSIYDSHGLTAFGDRLDAWLLTQSGAELTSYTLGGASPEWLLRGTVSPRGYLFRSCDGQPLLPRAKLNQRKIAAPSLEELIRVPEGHYKKQIVILTLGSNVPGTPEALTAKVDKLVRSFASHKDTACIWIGPPSVKKWSAGYGDKVYQAIRDGITSAGGPKRKDPLCHLIDSRPLSRYPEDGDGMHYGFSRTGIAAAHSWADGVIGEIKRFLSPNGT